jgi:hypothetical protein
MQKFLLTMAHAGEVARPDPVPARTALAAD